MRSFAGTGEEIDFAPLSNKQLMAIAVSRRDSKSHLEDVWQDVDGYNVPEEQIWSPAPELLPIVLRKLEGHGLDPGNQTSGHGFDQTNETSDPGQDGQLNQRCEDLFCTKNRHCEQAGCFECVILDRHDLGNCI